MTTLSYATVKRHLSDLLPHGAQSEIKRRISKRLHREFSLDYISKVLNPNRREWNFIIITEAKAIIKEQVEALEKENKEIQNLKQRADEISK